ncbi:MAG: DUF433 domain-containing protein [Acidobacteria bacterium]|nr:DUF433 domain-containing protein [Acidobacteriota bacterium]
MPRAKQPVKWFGRYIVSDPEICHGSPTFHGTRILVADVLEQVAEGQPWEAISEEWRGAVKPAAIAEAVRIANQAFADHASEYVAA